MVSHSIDISENIRTEVPLVPPPRQRMNVTDLEKVTGSENTTSKLYDPRVKARALQLYLTTDTAPTEIAIDLGVPVSAVVSWMHKDGWRKHKQQLETEALALAEDEYRRLITANRVPTLTRHLRVAQKLEDAIESAIDQLVKAAKEPGAPPLDTLKLKRLAETLSSAAAVSARAAAITDRPFGGDDGPQKRPLIMLNVQPREQGKIIDIKEDDA